MQQKGNEMRMKYIFIQYIRPNKDNTLQAVQLKLSSSVFILFQFETDTPSQAQNQTPSIYQFIIFKHQNICTLSKRLRRQQWELPLLIFRP